MAHRYYNYKHYDSVGSCIFIENVEVKRGPQRALFQCRCGINFQAFINDVKTYRINSCGCNIDDHKRSLYYRWKSIKIRCLNKNSLGYPDWGGRGINIYFKWIKDFDLFYDYMMSLPNAMKPGMSIDRINNDGNYEPGNLRWTDAKTQASNRRKFKKSKIH